MTTRRLFALLLLIALVLPLSAQAQPNLPFVTRFGNQITSQTASLSVVNNATAVTIFSGVFPMTGLFATPPSANVANAIAGGVGGLQVLSSWPVGPMPIPLHVSLIGALSYASGTISLAANYGGGQTSAATVALINSNFSPQGAVGSQAGAAASAAAQLAAIRIDCWVIPVATGSGTLNSLGAAMLSCRAEVPSQASSYIVNVANYTGVGFNLASPQVLNIIWQWGTAAAGNALIIQSETVTLGW